MHAGTECDLLDGPSNRAKNGTYNKKQLLEDRADTLICQYTDLLCYNVPNLVVAWSTARDCGRSLAMMAGSSPATGMDVCSKCCAILQVVFCDGPITRLEESYRV
jgi:hypothetical protein